MLRELGAGRRLKQTKPKRGQLAAIEQVQVLSIEGILHELVDGLRLATSLDDVNIAAGVAWQAIAELAPVGAGFSQAVRLI